MIRADGDAVEIDVHVVPRASRSRVVGLLGDRLKIQLAAPPVDGAANAALVELVAKVVGVPKGSVCVVRGAASKRKTVRIDDIGVTDVRARLEAAW